MKFLLAFILILSTLDATDGMKNIILNTLDSDEVNSKVSLRLQKIKLNSLAKVDYKQHQKNIDTLKNNIATIVDLKQKLRGSKKLLKEQQTSYDEQNTTYATNIASLFSDAKGIKRESYYVVTHKVDQDYLQDLQNYLVDKYGVTQFEQSLEIDENSNGSSSFKSVIKTTKAFGEMQIETLKDYTFREKNLNFKILKVTQAPFVKTKQTLQNQTQESAVDKFAQESGVKVYQLSSIHYNHKDVIATQDINESEKSLIIADIDSYIDIKKITKNLTISGDKIQKELLRIEQTHDKELALLNKLASYINTTTSQVKDDELLLQTSIQEAQTLATIYNLELNMDEIDKLIIVTPKIYKEYVELGEEKEFILRKAKSYLSKITINDLKQSETLTDYVDLSTKNSEIQKMIEYESIHILPFIEGKSLGMFVFSTIEIEDKITQSNYVTKEFKYGKIEFVPVNKGYKKIFVANTELTIGIVKEFLQNHRQKKYFDEYCMQDSYLPEEAKDMKNVTQEFYDYPAVCMKIDKIEDLMKWLSQKTQKELVIPSVVDWSYIASNANSSDYCWGNATLEQMNEDGVKNANIYYEDGQDTTIEKVKQYKKSVMGMYDMCGNVHELVKDGEVFMVKGNSFISYMEKSDAPAMDYGEDLSPSLGLRVVYTTGE